MFTSLLIINLYIASVYNGGLVASLTYPARLKTLDTFEALLQLPEEATIGMKQWVSVINILQETTDPILQVPNELKFLHQFDCSF